MAARVAILMFLLLISTVECRVTCPQGTTYNSLHDSCIRVNKALMTWHDARHTCAQMDLDSDLVYLDSYPMISFLSEVMKGFGVSYCWVNVHDIWHDNHWVTTDGRPATYLPWNMNLKQPDGYDQQSCISHHMDSGTWQDQECITYLSSVVCEWKPRTTLNTVQSKGFLVVQEPYVLGYDYTLTPRANHTLPTAQCGRACANDFLCDVFGVHKMLPVNNCVLFAFAQNMNGRSRTIDVMLRSYHLYYK